jgi:hypothetical protein
VSTVYLPIETGLRLLLGQLFQLGRGEPEAFQGYVFEIWGGSKAGDAGDAGENF